MDHKKFDKLVELAKKDAGVFHELVFDPEKALAKMDFLGRAEKGAIVAGDPGELIAKLIGINQACGNTCSSSCDNTCGGSCGFTTNLQAVTTFEQGANFYSRISGGLEACGNTCTSSCGNTCGQSCGFTTNLVDDRFGQFQRYR